MSAHTPGARRLAELLIPEGIDRKGRPTRIPTAYGLKTREGIAAMIDSQTSAPDLLPFAEFIAKLGLPEDVYELDEGDATDETQRECFISYGMIRAARAAIRKATGE